MIGGIVPRDAEVDRLAAGRADHRVERVAVRADDFLSAITSSNRSMSTSSSPDPRKATRGRRYTSTDALPSRREDADLRRADRLAAGEDRRPVRTSSPRGRTFLRASRAFRIATRWAAVGVLDANHRVGAGSGAAPRS